MDLNNIFEKLGIYEIFGIWIPGALTVTYYLFTLREFFYSLFSAFGIKQNELSGDFLFVILYTAIAFFVGLVLHEIGKIVVDWIPCFRLSHINDRIFKKKLKKRPNLVFKRIRYEYQQAIIHNQYRSVDFDKATSYLKFYVKDTTRNDKYHAIYALSRSLCLGFIGHIILLIIDCFSYICKWLPFEENPNLCLNIFWLILIDVFLALLFYIRTYRYFHLWVKNVYLQYEKAYKKKIILNE